MKETKKLICHKKIITNKQLPQVSALYNTPFLSTFPRRSTQIYNSQYGDAALMSHRGTPISRLCFAIKAITFRQ